MKSAPAIACALFMISTAVQAGPVRSGATLPASSCESCVQGAAAAAGNPAGSLLVAWETLAPTASRGIAARFFRPLGAARGADFQAVAAPPGTTVGDVALAGNAKGFVLAWTQSGDDSDVYARRYSPTGVALGAPIPVNVDRRALPRAPEDFAPAVALAADGGFTVAWVRVVPFYDGASPGTRPAIFVRRFTLAGLPRSAPQQISTGLVADDRPALCVATGGAVTVVWTSVDRFEPFQPSLEGVSLRRMQALGTLQAQTLVLAPPTSSQPRPAAACGPDGGAVVAWTSELTPAAPDGDIVAQRFAKDGKRIGARFVVNANRAGAQTAAALSFDSTGALVAAWASREDFDDVLRIRRFGANGAPLSGDVEVWNDGASGAAPGAPTLAHTKGGDFAVAWADTRRKILVQRFRP